MEKESKIITVAGKGGVGKTSLSACMVRLLTEAYPDSKILAIDADPAVGLSVALGVDVKMTLDDIRMGVVDSVENGEAREALELLSEARFRIFDALVEEEKFAFLAIGRPESSGCYCKVNSYLKEVIGILANSFDFVVIDGEAGIEQIQRRVMEKVTHLVLVSDQSKKGIQVINTIKGVADDLIEYEKIGAVINRMTNPELAGINGSVGEWGWDGAFGNWFCVDPKENLTCVYLTTNLPGDHYRFIPRLMASMYASLD